MSSLDSCLYLLFGEAHLTEGEEKLPNRLQNERKLEEEEKKESNDHVASVFKLSDTTVFCKNKTDGVMVEESPRVLF